MYMNNKNVMERRNTMNLQQLELFTLRDAGWLNVWKGVRNVNFSWGLEQTHRLIQSRSAVTYINNVHFRIFPFPIHRDDDGIVADDSTTLPGF